MSIAATARKLPKQRIESLADRAVDVLTELLEEPTAEPIRLKAATEILDRNDATSKLQRIQATAIVISPEDAKLLHETMNAGELVAQKYGARYLGAGATPVNSEGVT